MTSSTQSAANDNEASEELVSKIAVAIRDAVDALVGVDAAFGAREVAALDLSNRAVRRVLEGDLQAIADQFGDAVMIDGLLHRRHQPGSVTYHSLCGPLHVQRWTYRLVGVRNGATRIPVELTAGMIERATPALAYSVAQGYAKAPIRSVEEDLRAARREPPSRSTLERMAKTIGSRTQRYVPRIEQALRRSESLPEGAVAISLGLDRTTIPMEEDRREGEEPRSRPRRGRKPRVRKAPPPVSVHYRMAYVGTIAIMSKYGDALLTRRYAAPACEGPWAVVKRMMADLKTALTQNPKLHVGVVQDNAPELWNLMREALGAQPLVGQWHEVVDRYHLMERLAKALEIVEPNAKRRRTQLERWRRALDKTDRAIHYIERYFELFGRSRKFLDNKTILEIDRVIGRYVVCYKHFRYASIARLGLPTGSGATEGACRSLVSARAKRSGQRWRPEGIGAVLALRSLLESDRLPKFWNHFALRYFAHCEAA